jgi:hypothetical protein
MSGDDEAAWRKQQALERQSTSRVEMQLTQPVVTGGDVCVWDAFGAFWCEKTARRAFSGGGHRYVQNVTQQGQALVYEGFCGCGADTPF